MNAIALLGIARYELTRVVRDRLTLFFLIVLPVLVVVIVGSTFGGTFRVLPIGVVDEIPNSTSTEVVAVLDADGLFEVTRYDDEADLRRDLRTGRISGGLILTDDGGDDGAVIDMVTDPTSSASATVQRSLQGVIDEYAAELTAAEIVVRTGYASDAASALELVRGLDIDRTSIEQIAVGDGDPPPDSEFAYTVPSQLVLFMFVSALGAGAALVDVKRLGIGRRMRSTPTSAPNLIGGLALARMLLAVGQAALLIGVGAVVFDITWGDPTAVIALVVVYALGAVGAGLLIGAVANTPDQAMALGVPLAMGMGMLGGTMWPLDIVGDTMRAVGHVVPQAWAMDGWVTLVFDSGSTRDIAGELAVLAAFAVALLTTGAITLNRRLSR